MESGVVNNPQEIVSSQALMILHSVSFPPQFRGLSTKQGACVCALDGRTERGVGSRLQARAGRCCGVDPGSCATNNKNETRFARRRSAARPRNLSRCCRCLVVPASTNNRRNECAKGAAIHTRRPPRCIHHPWFAVPSFQAVRRRRVTAANQPTNRGEAKVGRSVR